MLRSSQFAGALLLLGTVVSIIAGRPLAAQGAFQPRVETVGVSPAGVSSAGAVQPAGAGRSLLPAPAGADVWVDVAGTSLNGIPTPAVAGQAPGVVRKYGVLVFRPSGDSLKWEELVQLYVSQGVLPAGARVLTSVEQNPGTRATSPTSPMNYKDTRVYKPRAGGDALVLVLVRNLRTRHQLAFAVMLSGTFENLQAALYANDLAETLAENARRQRMQPPVPAGAQPAMPERRLDTPALLRELQQSILQSPTVSARVKQMAQTMIPQASSVTLSAWKTPAPLSDSAFFEVYSREAARLGWGAPVSKDETQPGSPTLLFHRATGDGVMMIRAQPTPVRIGVPAAPSTTVYVLMMEGRFSR